MIKQATIFAANYEETLAFYKKLFSSLIEETSEDQFKVLFPLNTLEIKRRSDAERPYYHFAFLIPYHKFESAKKNVSAIVPLNTEDGKDEMSFMEGINSFYFDDPSGNIVEFIGKKLDENGTGTFSVEDVHGLAEISLTPQSISEAAEQLDQAELLGKSPDKVKLDGLNFISIQETTILLAPERYRWLFSEKRAKPFPQTIIVNDQQISVDAEGKLSITKM